MRRWVTAAGLASAVAACAQAPVAQPTNGFSVGSSNPRPGPGTAPAWLDQLPKDPSSLYAVGVCGPTYYPDDALKYATDKARANLGMAISTHVENVVLVQTTNTGTASDQVNAVEATHDYTDSIVENSQIVSTWIDRSGSYSGTPGTAFALARIDRAKVPSGATAQTR